MGRKFTKPGDAFEHEVSRLYRLLGFDVVQNHILDGVEIDIHVSQVLGGIPIRAVIECKDTRIGASERDQVLVRQQKAREDSPDYLCIAVSSVGFTPDALTALRTSGVVCLTYEELLTHWVPLHGYAETLLKSTEGDGEPLLSRFIHPFIISESSSKQQKAVDFVTKWIANRDRSFLVVLGDLGTGKTTLASFITHELAVAFLNNPVQNPAPVLIPLGKFQSKDSVAEIVTGHFAAAGFNGVSFDRFEQLLTERKIILVFDAFDEMCDRAGWEATKQRFKGLCRVGLGKGKVILTCRTHYFRDCAEQEAVTGTIPQMSVGETALMREIKTSSWGEVAYLQEFTDVQIREYLRKVRPKQHEHDWQQIQSIYNLADLAHRPLMLDMIVASIDKLSDGISLTAAELYNVYTSIWADREDDKGRILDRGTKLALMRQLAWRLWSGSRDSIHADEIEGFVSEIAAEEAIRLGDNSPSAVAQLIQTATFLRRDQDGVYSFMHRSFLEYLLADHIVRKLNTGQEDVLDTRRIEQKTIYFASLIDSEATVARFLSRILVQPYSERRSENALQLLYWTTRMQLGMEDSCSDYGQLREQLLSLIPEAPQLNSADLEGMNLEGVAFRKANLRETRLRGANLRHALLDGDAWRADLREVDDDHLSLKTVELEGCKYTDGGVVHTEIHRRKAQRRRVEEEKRKKERNLLTVLEARNGENIGRHIRLQGWLRTRRDSKGGFSFLEVNDGSCMANIQIIADGQLSNYESEIKSLTAGCSVSVDGEVKESGGKGQATEIHAASVTVHGWADPESYPLQKKRHSFEKLREWAHLRPRTNSFGAVARVRNCVCRSIHDFFQQEGFLYVHTPVITASDCEGAGEMFRVTTIDLENPPKQEGKVDYSLDFFDRPSFLTVSGQLEAEIYACALGRVYTFGPTFRAENSNTSRHLAEFWMIEPEMAFYELPDNMDLAERLLKRIARDALDQCGEDMQFFNERIEKTVLETLQSIAESEFVRLPYTEAITILEQSGQKLEFPIHWGSDLQSEHERYLTEQEFKRPVILYDYPRTIKPFYMYVNDDEKTVRAMDVLVPRVGEIIGGSQREHRLEILQSRMTEQDLNPDDYWWYLDLRRYGTVPHSGFGLGLERTIQFVTGMANIRDVIPFPRTPGNAEF